LKAVIVNLEFNVREIIMIFKETKLKGAFVIEIEKLKDERGYFARAWCEREFRENGLNNNFVQFNVSNSIKKGTLRGIHYQDPPYAETKLVRCTRGSVYDVMIDLRPDSPSFLQWTSEILTPDNGKMMYIPKGFGHAFLSLEDHSMVFYQVDEFFEPDYYRGLCWNDPELKIIWPEKVTVISERDQEWEDFDLDRLTALKGMV
jgi:dTDP-4-dehydrorhamnose 3,5-epimerase